MPSTYLKEPFKISEQTQGTVDSLKYFKEIQLFQFMLSDQSFKPTGQDRMVVWVFTRICILVKMKTTSFYFCAWTCTSVE